MLQRKLLLYTPQAHKAGYRLEEAVAAVLPEETTEVVRTMEGLVRRIKRPHNGLEVAVIMATGRKKLQELQSLEQMLESLRTILILPDADPRTIAQAHRLRPRYITDIRSDFQDVAAVLKKMLALPDLPIANPPSF
jgi:hypothetical protein